MNYIKYNREERDICAHLFRLLLSDQKEWKPLKKFLNDKSVSSPSIFCEVALLRDAYHIRKEYSSDFLEGICDEIARLNSLVHYTKFSSLDESLKNPKNNHPKQIYHKLKAKNAELSVADKIVYGTLQAMFNAKPDLVICEGGNLFVIEAKYTLGFDEDQMERTRQLAKLWSKLLYKDLGFQSEPKPIIKKLGLKKFDPDYTWEEVYKISKENLGDEDFSTKVFSKVL